MLEKVWEILKTLLDESSSLFKKEFLYSLKIDFTKLWEELEIFCKNFEQISKLFWKICGKIYRKLYANFKEISEDFRKFYETLVKF